MMLSKLAGMSDKLTKAIMRGPFGDAIRAKGLPESVANMIAKLHRYGGDVEAAGFGVAQQSTLANILRATEKARAAAAGININKIPAGAKPGGTLTGFTVPKLPSGVKIPKTPVPSPKPESILQKYRPKAQKRDKHLGEL